LNFGILPALKNYISKLHAKLGDFWWYSLMIFVAARAADCLNVFVGLWLVPKYVPASELGAVQPLTQYATFFALPVAALASTFRNEVSNLSLRGEFGKLKTLMLSVFAGTAVFFVGAVLVSRFVLPLFLERIRIVEGSLGLIIIVFSFVCAVSPVFSCPLQALKKFKATTVISLVGAPIRLLTMLATLPLRAITGYFVGQTSVPAFSIFTSVFALRKELSVRAEPYWTRPALKKFLTMFVIFAASAVLGGVGELVQNMVLRQRLPDIDSAAYYMVTRFVEISAFLSTTLMVTIFPFAAELAAKGKNTNTIVNKSFLAVVGTNALLAIVFSFAGRPLLAVLPGGAAYASYWWAIPWLIGIGTFNVYGTLFLTAEVSANRFRSLFLTLPLNLTYSACLLLVTGQGYYLHLVGTSVARFLAAVNVTSLHGMLVWMSVAAILRFLIYIFYSKHVQRRHALRS